PQVARAEPEPAPRTSPPPVERPRPRPARAETKTETAPKVAPDAGTAGREKARVEVAQNLAQATASLDKAIGDLGKALPAADRKDNGRERPRRQARGSVRGARTSTQLEAVDLVADLSAATGGEGAVGARTIDVAAITQVALAGSGEGFGDGAGGGGGDGTGASAPGGAGGEIRSNASLLAVVRRYAPGIQFCYENVLKQDPGLRGKLVVNLTVAADGTVDDVIVLEDTLDSAAVTTCVLAQMRDWRFEAVPAGVVTFQAPFVFTPPRD
ncbi:energy transducer TonB, partial [bacterium]|nr:energy transducer TonB [bacterium]